MEKAALSALRVLLFIAICSALTFIPLTVSLSAQVEDTPSEVELIQDSLDIFNFLGLQEDATHNDLILHLIWLNDDKIGLQQAAFEAIGSIESIKSKVSLASLPQEFTHPRQLYIRYLTELQDIYTNIEQKENNELKEDFQKAWKTRKEYIDILVDISEKHIPKIDISDDFNALDEEIKLIRDGYDKDMYIHALDLLYSNQFQDAYDQLDILQQKYQNTDFEKCILLVKTDCVFTMDSRLNTTEGEDLDRTSMEILDGLVNTTNYSPVIFEIFYKWRTIYQMSYCGMSNFSEIPNTMYNEKRWQLLQVVRLHIRQNPDDLWAKAQAYLLLSLPNIKRGGKYGNTNLTHWTHLYMHTLDEE